MSLTKKIINHSFWLLVGNSIGRLGMFLTNIVAARILSQEVFGQFMMIRSTVSMIEGIISGSLSSLIIKRIAEISHQDNESLKKVISALFVVNISIASLLSFILFFITPFIVNYFFIAESTLIKGFYIGCILIIFTTLASLTQSLLIGFEEYKKIAFSGIISSTVSFPIVVVLIYTLGLFGAITGVTIYFMIDFLVKYIQLRRIYTKNLIILDFKNIWDEGKNILTLSSPLFLATLITSFAFWYARVLTINDTKSFESIAIFDAAFQWLSIIMIITGATTSVALPMMSKRMNSSNDMKKVFHVNLLVNFLISILITTGFILYADDIMSLYGDNYIEGQTALVILSITSIFFTLSSLYNKWMISHKRIDIVLLSSSIATVMLFIVLEFSSYNATNTLAFAFGTFYFVSFIVFLFFSKALEVKK